MGARWIVVSELPILACTFIFNNMKTKGLREQNYLHPQQALTEALETLHPPLNRKKQVEQCHI